MTQGWFAFKETNASKIFVIQINFGPKDSHQAEMTKFTTYGSLNIKMKRYNKYDLS